MPVQQTFQSMNNSLSKQKHARAKTLTHHLINMYTPGLLHLQIIGGHTVVKSNTQYISFYTSEQQSEGENVPLFRIYSPCADTVTFSTLPHHSRWRCVLVWHHRLEVRRFSLSISDYRGQYECPLITLTSRLEKC